MTELPTMTRERRGTVEEVLEPLSAATREKLAAPRFFDAEDHLFVSLDAEERFRVRLVRIVPLPRGATVSGDRFIVEGREYTRAAHGPSLPSKRFLERFPEGYHHGVKRPEHTDLWTLAPTDYTALILYHAWPSRQLVFVTEAARELYQRLLRRFFDQNGRATLSAAYKVKRIPPPLPEHWVEHPERPLSEYQKAAVSIAAGQEGFALFMDRGTGKTPTSVGILCEEARAHRAAGGKLYRVLVACPGQVRTNWAQEVASFATCVGKVTIIRGTKTARLRQLALSISDEDDAELLFSVSIISYESLVSSLQFFKAVPWDRIILDESHVMKDPATKRAKALLELRDSAKRRLILTGTPIGNHCLDLWAQLEFLGKGMSGFASYGLFRLNHAEMEDVDTGAGGVGVQRLAGTRNLPMLQERLARVSFAVSKDEAGLQLPDKVRSVLEVEMTPAQAKLYEGLAQELYAEIEERLAGPNGQISVENSLTQLLRLAQITSGFVTLDGIADGNGGWAQKKRVIPCATPNPKIEALVEDVTSEDADPRSKFVVWAIWTADIEAIYARLQEVGLRGGTYYGKTSQADRESNIRAFERDKDFRYLVCNPMTAAEGLNLVGYDPRDPAAADTFCGAEYFFSQNWSAILRGQAEDRAHRRGTRMPVRIVDIVVPGSIDEVIRARVQGKLDDAWSVTDLRNVLAKISARLPGAA